RTPEQKNDNDKLDAFAQLWPTFFAATRSARIPLSRRGHSRRRLSRPPRTNRSANKIVSKFPHRARKLATFRKHVVKCVNEHVDFFFADDERRQNFQHIHRVTSYLGENAVLAQHLSHDHLRKEHLVDLVQKL